MRQKHYCNRHEYAFLREVRNHPHGLPIDHWPATATLKRWLKRKHFRRALQGIIDTFRLEAELMSAGASARAAQMMQEMLSGFEQQGITYEALTAHHEQLLTLSRIVRMDFIRQRERRMMKLASTRRSVSVGSMASPSNGSVASHHAAVETKRGTELRVFSMG